MCTKLMRLHQGCLKVMRRCVDHEKVFEDEDGENNGG